MNTNTLIWVIAIIIWLLLAVATYKLAKKSLVRLNDPHEKWTNGNAVLLFCFSLMVWYLVLIFSLIKISDKWGNKTSWWDKESKF